MYSATGVGFLESLFIQAVSPFASGKTQIGEGQQPSVSSVASNWLATPEGDLAFLSWWRLQVCWKSCALFIYLFFLYNFLMFIFEREGETEHEQGRGREGDTESKAASRLWAVSTELNTGLKLNKLWDRDLSRSRTLNQLSHPGAPRHIFLNKETEAQIHQVTWLRFYCWKLVRAKIRGLLEWVLFEPNRDLP